jgi:hypothetical protein
LECFTEPHYLDILIAHETAHSFHTQCGSDEWPDFAVGEALFGEGLATMASAVMYPGRRKRSTCGSDQATMAGWPSA